MITGLGKIRNRTILGDAKAIINRGNRQHLALCIFLFFGMIWRQDGLFDFALGGAWSGYRDFQVLKNLLELRNRRNWHKSALAPVSTCPGMVENNRHRDACIHLRRNRVL